RARGSAHLVQLDLVDDPNGRRRLAEGLYEFIGEAPAESTLERIASSSERLNSPTSRPGEEPDLPAEWRELLAADGEYQELMAAFGYRAEVGANQGDSR
ncbi:MAG TPA: hypothetical protein VFM94_07715, partial [Solirubrobacterales bacterium]|nr:hypothetical protein [Solirubrobacterales bacterium]